MKFEALQENLNQALGHVSKVASSSRSSLPILTNLLIKTEDGQLKLSATNLEIAITQTIGAKVIDEGSITVPARLLQEYVNSLPKNKVSIELAGHKLQISSADYRSSINCVVADEYPVIPEVKGDPVWKIGSDQLRQALSQVVFAASSDDARPVLTGVLMQVVDGVVYLVATDSYRLSEKKLGPCQGEFQVLIPSSALSELQRILPDSKTEVFVFAEDEQIAFRFDEIELVSRLVEGKYPDYQKLLPTSFETEANIDRLELLNASKLASLFARESAGSIQLQVHPDKNALEVRSVATQLGENSTNIAAEVKGDGEVSLNVRYVMDGLNAFTDKDVIFSINGKLEPCRITSENSDLIHIIMPLKS